MIMKDLPFSNVNIGIKEQCGKVYRDMNLDDT